MKKNYTLFLFFACLFFFASCEQDYVSPTNNTVAFQPTEITSLSQAKETVLFQFDHQNIETGERYGFIIDHQGKLMTYTVENEVEANLLPEVLEGEWETSKVEHLHALSNEVAQLSEEEVLVFYKLSRDVSLYGLSGKIADENEATITTISSLKKETYSADEVSGGCGAGSCSATTQPEDVTIYRNIVLKMEGTFNQENDGVRGC